VAGAKFPFYDPTSDTTYYINAEEFLSDTPNPDNLWNAMTVYNTGDLATYAQTPDSDLQIWISTEDDNSGNIPGPASTHWTLANKVTASGSLIPYEAGVYTGDNVYVSKIIGGKLFFFQLISPVRPYNSFDFDAELLAGDWIMTSAAAAGNERIYSFDSDLFTEQQYFFKGPINTLVANVSDAINTYSFEAGLDADPIVYDSLADLTALQTWITTNVTSSSIVYWIKILVVYKAGRTEQSEINFIYAT
jgi:hypothetical protein